GGGGRGEGGAMGGLRGGPLVGGRARRVDFLVREPRLVDAERARQDCDEDAYVDRVAKPPGRVPVTAREDDLDVVTIEPVGMLLLDQRPVDGAEHEPGRVGGQRRYGRRGTLVR